MERSYGSFATTKKEGLLRAVHFPQLALMDVTTPDGRELAADGGGVRELPRAVKAQYETLPGHMGAVPAGTLQKVEMHDDGIIEGWGWLVDNEDGRKMELFIETGTLFHNSVDLADVEYEIVWESDDPADGEAFWTIEKILFTKWNIGATTFVDMPAFPDAHGELTAALEAHEATVDRSVPLEVNFASTRINIDLHEPAEVTAALEAGEIVQPWDSFHVPEPPKLQPLRIDAQGNVSFHLAPWGKCHDGIDNRCVVAPRPNDYSDFHGPGVLTDRGIVETGPVFLLGGHPAKPLGNGDRWAAYGGVENAWADVRATNGRLGVWCCGRVRPGVDAAAIYAARASKVSGHWRTDRSLAAIVSVNVPGFRVPGSTLSFDTDGAIVEDGEVLEMVASLRAPAYDPAEEARTMRDDIEASVLAKLPKSQSLVWAAPNGATPEKVAAQVIKSREATGNVGSINITHETSSDVALAADTETEPDTDDSARRLALELELEIESSELPLQA